MTSNDALGKLSKYLQRSETDPAPTLMSEDELSAYAPRLNSSLLYLRNEVLSHETSLEKLRKNSEKSPLGNPPTTKRERLHQVRNITRAYKSLVSAEPVLPSAQSPVPALLALRNTLCIIEESKSSIAAILATLTKARGCLRRESELLRDVEHISTSLHARLVNLRNEHRQHAESETSAIASALTTEQQHRQHRYAKDMHALVKALNKFVGDHLASMLAAEDLGGPVVGELTDISDDNLKAGFTASGKPKKTGGGDADTRKRAQRNVQIWGDKISVDSNDNLRPEKQCAALAFRALAEDLLNAATETKQNESYVQLKREDAAARFLVRTKAATFALEDARMLRLRDPGE